MKKLFTYLSLLFILTCAKEDSQDPGTTPSNITPRYTLTASAGEGGSVSPTTGSFNAGTQVSVTATPNSGYQFTSWSNGSTVNPVTVTLNSNTSITANFEVLINSYTLTVVSTDGGSATGAGEYNEGTEVTLTATASDGYRFTGWSDGSTEESITITLSEDTALTANFELIPDPPSMSLSESTTLIFTKGQVDNFIINIIVPGGYKSLSVESQNGETTIFEEPLLNESSGQVIIGYSPTSIINNYENITIAGKDSIIVNITDQYDTISEQTFEVITQPEPTFHNYFKPSHDLQFNSLFKIDFKKVRILNNKANEIGFGNNPNYMPNSLWVDYTEGLDQDTHTAVAVLDLNQDGYEDFIVAPTYTGSAEFSSIKVDYEVYLYEGGEFIYKSNDIFLNQIPKSYLARKALVGDFDGDGDGDAYFAHTGMDLAPYPRERESSILLINDFNNNGKIKVVEIDEFASSHEASSADIDNDGDLDIFSASLVDPNGRFSGYHYGLLLNDGNGNFQRSNNILYENILEAFSLINTSEISDIDNDGYYDIFYGGGGSIGILTNNIYGFPRVLWGEQDYIYKTTNQTLLPNVQGFDNIVDVDFYDLDMDGTKEVIILRTGDNLDDDGNLINAGDEFINTLIGESYYYGGYYIQIVKLNDRSPIDVTSDFISDNFYRTSNNVWSEGDYNSDWIKWLIVKDYDNNGLIDIFTPLIYSVGPGDKNFKRWEWNGSKFIKVE